MDTIVLRDLTRTFVMGDTAVHALNVMRETGNPRLLVVRHVHLAGILTYADLLREKRSMEEL